MALDGAMRMWEAALGPGNIVRDTAHLTAAATATFSTGRTIPAILRPGSRQEVEHVLRIANQWRIPVYPISSGRNWGYGSRVPSACFWNFTAP